MTGFFGCGRKPLLLLLVGSMIGGYTVFHGGVGMNPQLLAPEMLPDYVP